MKRIIIPIIFLVLLLGISLWLGRGIKPDLSNDIPEYQEGGGTGHPLWKD